MAIFYVSAKAPPNKQLQRAVTRRPLNCGVMQLDMQSHEERD